MGKKALSGLVLVSSHIPSELVDPEIKEQECSQADSRLLGPPTVTL